MEVRDLWRASLWSFVPAFVVTAGVTLLVLVVRASLEGRSAGVGDVISALAVALLVGIASAIVPFALTRRIRDTTRYSAGVYEAPIQPTIERSRDRFDRFDDAARNVLTAAQDEAQRFNHNYIGTEHLLLGVVRVESVASQVLRARGVDADKVRTAVEFIIGRGDTDVSGEVGLTPRAKRVIELSIEEARHLNAKFIGAEHILLGLLAEGEGIAAGVLESLGLDLERLRVTTVRLATRAEDGPNPDQPEQA